MEVSTIIKRNRDSLRKMENEMLLTLKGLSVQEDERDNNQQENAAPEDSPGHQQASEVAGSLDANDDDYQQAAPKWLKGYTINNKIRVSRLNYYGHIIRSTHGGILKAALELKINKPKKVGRPAYSWRTCIRQDIERSGKSLQFWQETALDRTKMKEQTKKLFDTLIESEYEEDSDSDWDSDDSSLTPSVFNGLSDEESFFVGNEENEEF